MARGKKPLACHVQRVLDEVKAGVLDKDVLAVLGKSKRFTDVLETFRTRIKEVRAEQYGRPSDRQQAINRAYKTALTAALTLCPETDRTATEEFGESDAE